MLYTRESSDSNFLIKVWGIFLSLFLILPLFLNSQDHVPSLQKYIHNIWTTDNGLPENSIQTITQTSDGYLWFGTQLGLARFNGRDFKIFDQFNTKEISYSYISALCPSRDGGLWIGTRGAGLSYQKNGNFRVIEEQGDLSQGFITSIFEDQSGRLWIGTENHGLNILRNGNFSHLESPADDPAQQVNQITQDRNGQVWIASGGGLFKYSPTGFIPFSAPEGLPKVAIASVLEDQNGRLWIGTDGQGLYHYTAEHLEKVDFKGVPSPEVILSLYEDRSGAIWIGTRIGIIRLKSGQFNFFSSQEGLSNYEILSFFQDREGILWLGTSNGINSLKPRNVTIIDREFGLNVDMVWSVFEDRDRNLWLGTNNGGVSKVSNGKIFSFTQKAGLPSDVVRNIYQDPHGSMWIGTIKGLVQMNQHGQVINIYDQDDGLSNEFIRVSYQDQKGNFWVGTSNGLFRREGNRFQSFPLSDKSLQLLVFCVAEDSEGALWVGTYLGFFIIRDQKIEHFGGSSLVESTVVLDIFHDKWGETWLGSQAGLLRWADGQLIRYQKEQGLPDNTVYAITMDENQNLWMSSNQGIYSLKRSQLLQFKSNQGKLLQPKIYNKTDGMRSTECNGGSQASVCRAQDGTLWFPTIHGVVGIDPQKNTRINTAPPVIIETILVDDVPFNPEARLKLKPGARKIEFQYAALTYYAQEKIHFKTKLENYDENWLDAGQSYSIYYSNLPPGEYTFHITADYEGSQSEASFVFFQKPYFYQTWWFILSGIFTVIFLGLGIYGLRVKQLVIRGKKLKELVKQQTLQLQEANQELQRLTLQDELTGIPNQRRFTQFYANEWQRAIRVGIPISVIMVDIDFFKLYNDTYGHMEGDKCLCAVAQTLQDTCLRASDIVARCGGEEFVIALTATTPKGVAVVAERVRRKIEDLKIPNQPSTISDYLTISLGCASVIPEIDSDSALLVKAADEALYHSKKTGRNRITQINPM